MIGLWIIKSDTRGHMELGFITCNQHYSDHLKFIEHFTRNKFAKFWIAIK